MDDSTAPYAIESYNTILKLPIDMPKAKGVGVLLGYFMPPQITLTLLHKVTIGWECESPTVGRFEL